MEMKNKSGITRKDAIKKMGKYAALTAIGTFAILNPKKALASSFPPDPGSNPWWQIVLIFININFVKRYVQFLCIDKDLYLIADK